MDRIEHAAQLKRMNNCCQAVLLAYADELHMDPGTLMKLGSAFGSGMATMDGTCGALVGAEMVLGLLGKQPVRADAKQLFTAFERQCGSSVCKTLKGVGTGRMLCSCEDCVRNAAQLAADQLAPAAV
jgi:C_GCAxxG_C_C family probable redox protein